jgi:hypothetical protein
LDTNHNGVLDKDDDPFMPYYPGDAFVDVIGLSMYHLGATWPWSETEDERNEMKHKEPAVVEARNRPGDLV